MQGRVPARQVDKSWLCDLESGDGNGVTGVSGVPLPPLASPFGRGAPRSLPCSWGFSRHSQISQPRHWRIWFCCNPIFLVASGHEVWQAEFPRFRTLPHRCRTGSDFCCFRSVARVCSGQLNWPFLTLVISNWSCFGMAWKNLGNAGLAVAGDRPDFGLGKRIEQSAVGSGFGRGASPVGDMWSIYWNIRLILIYLRWRNSMTLWSLLFHQLTSATLCDVVVDQPFHRATLDPTTRWASRAGGWCRYVTLDVLLFGDHLGSRWRALVPIPPWYLKGSGLGFGCLWISQIRGMLALFQVFPRIRKFYLFLQYEKVLERSR